jgi:membrane protein DedA with SNARE-associated domain
MMLQAWSWMCKSPAMATAALAIPSSGDARLRYHNIVIGCRQWRRPRRNRVKGSRYDGRSHSGHGGMRCKAKSGFSQHVASEDGASLSDALIGLIPIYGPWIIFAIVAFESAGVPLPGETILVAAALLAATTGRINIVLVVLAAAAGAIVGDGMGYMVGRRLGLLLLRRYGRYIGLDADRLLIGQYLFFQYGNAVVFFGRFIAVLRMFAALLAGANSMPAGRFFLFNITGGICWASLFGFGTYALGTEIYRISGTLSVISLALFVAAGYAIATFIRRNEATLRRRAEAALSDHSTA